MILFTKENSEKIISGKKTQTRRYWKNKRMKPGNSYFCQTSLKPNTRFARVKCLRIWEWDGETISDQDALAEGYADAAEFLAKYNELNEHKIEDESRTHYAIEFQVSETYIDGVATVYFRQKYARTNDGQIRLFN